MGTAVVVVGNGRRGRDGVYRITPSCVELVREAERLAAAHPVEAVVLTGWGGRRGGEPEAEQMRAVWAGPAVELVVEPTASNTAQNAARTLPLLVERGIERAVVVCAPLHLRRTRFFFSSVYGRAGIAAEFRVGAVARRPRALARELAAASVTRRHLRAVEAELAGPGPRVSDTLVFVPAWNEEENLPAVFADLGRELPGVDVLVVDDGSTDRTARVAREHGAEVLSLGQNRGLPVGIAAGYRFALERGYAFCGRVDADGQHPAGELARLLALVRSGACDVAVGSRFVSGEGYAPYRYRPDRVRRFGTAMLRRAMGLVLGRPFGDATSGLYAVNAKALPLLAEPFATEAPEVEALIRITDAGLRLEEVPVDMAARASGESKLRGGKAVRVVLTVIGTLVLAKVVRARRPR